MEQGNENEEERTDPDMRAADQDISKSQGDAKIPEGHAAPGKRIRSNAMHSKETFPDDKPDALNPRSEFDQRSVQEMAEHARRLAEDNDRVLSIRRIFDSPDIPTSSLLHAEVPTGEDFEAVKRLYASKRVDPHLTGHLIRRMLIPMLRERPNAYRVASADDSLFAYDPKSQEFVVDLTHCLVTDESKIAYNNPKILMGALADGSVFWMGGISQATTHESIADTMREISRRFDEESAKELPDESLMARLARQHSERMSEMRRVCNEVKARMNNVHTAVAAAEETSSLIAAKASRVAFRIDRALWERPGIGLDQFFGMAQIDEDSFYRAVDSVLSSFIGAFGSSACARYGHARPVAEVRESVVVPTSAGIAEEDLAAPGIAILRGHFDEKAGGGAAGGSRVEEASVQDPLDKETGGNGSGGGSGSSSGGSSDSGSDGDSGAEYRSAPFHFGLDKVEPNEDPDRCKMSADVLERMQERAGWWPAAEVVSRMRAKDASEVRMLANRYRKMSPGAIADELVAPAIIGID